MTSAAEKVGHTEKEKVEKRRALGRGLESLLPGPRVVPGARPSTGGIGEQQVPRRDAPRNDNEGKDQSGDHFSGVIRTEVEESAGEHAASSLRSDEAGRSDGSAATQTGAGVAADTRAGAPAPHNSALQGDRAPGDILAMADPSRVPANLVVNLEIADIDKNPFQTRYIDDNEALEELTESIKVSGVIQPVMVRPSDEEGRYVLILGERRLHASKKAGKTTIPAMVKRVSPQQAAEMTIIENLQREDLNCIEQAEAFRVLANEFQLTQAEIGQRVGLSRTAVANYMRLLKLTQPTMEHLLAGRLTFQDARELLKLEDRIVIEQAAEKVVKEQMKFEQVETMVMHLTGWGAPLPEMQEKKKSGSRWVDPNVRAAQVDLERLLGVRVRIRDKKGRGKIVIEYSTVDDYERVVEMLRGAK